MINFQIFGLARLMQMLALEEKVAGDRRRNLEMLPPGSLSTPISHLRLEESECQRLSGLIKFALHICKQLEIVAGIDRTERLLRKLERSAMPFNDLEPELRVLNETIEDGLRYIGFYHYPSAKRDLISKAEEQWRPTISAFSSARPDVIAAVDCYALGHYTASVFHAMRVLEHGLKEMAASVNLSFDTQVWHDIISQVENRVREIGDKWPKGTLKTDWMGFYSGVAKDFFHFKDGWRNHVSHNRATYDEATAHNVLEHVRTFMNYLSTRLSETVES
jgi:hypothetical protein